MCSLCGVLGAEAHWSDRSGNPSAFGAAGAPLTRRRERLHRVALANRVLGHYGLKLSDWQGASYLLASRTGRTVIVDHLPGLWAAAESMAGRRCDPLDPALVATLEKS